MFPPEPWLNRPHIHLSVRTNGCATIYVSCFSVSPCVALQLLTYALYGFTVRWMLHQTAEIKGF
jgi:hypothetical protein